LWSAANFHADRLIQLQPQFADHYARRGAARAQLQEWDSALADYAQAVERGARGHNNLYSTAILFLNAGRLDEYRKICRLTLEQIEAKSHPGNINTRVWTCSLVDAAVANPAQLVNFMESAIERVDSANKSVLLNTLGLALYRAGRFDDAVTAIHQSMDANANSREGIVTDWLILAMAHHQLGRPDQSRHWLEKSIAWLEELGKNASQKDGEPAWDERIEFRLLRAEAESLIGVSQAIDPV
jgi:tetratricopeptide (TPR) repeat protein